MTCGGSDKGNIWSSDTGTLGEDWYLSSRPYTLATHNPDPSSEPKGREKTGTAPMLDLGPSIRSTDSPSPIMPTRTSRQVAQPTHHMYPSRHQARQSSPPSRHGPWGQLLPSSTREHPSNPRRRTPIPSSRFLPRRTRKSSRKLLLNARSNRGAVLTLRLVATLGPPFP